MKKPLFCLTFALSVLAAVPAPAAAERLESGVPRLASTEDTASPRDRPAWQWALGSAVLLGALAAGWLIKPLALPVREIGRSGPGKKAAPPPISV